LDEYTKYGDEMLNNKPDICSNGDLDGSLYLAIDIFGGTFAFSISFATIRLPEPPSWGCLIWHEFPGPVHHLAVVKGRASRELGSSIAGLPALPRHSIAIR
jgi:hypothetical protein